MPTTSDSHDTVISAVGLSKCYELMRSRGRNQWITASVARGAVDAVKRVLMPWRKADKPEKTLLWSLDDVTFDVSRGEVIGLIGHNGAGKTTLLRVLSGITEPTRGRAVVRGRLNSLLEVGIGFHPELTGRENIYLSGTILGMTRPEVSRKLDEIIDFAEMAQFIDTPVKRYSSGMTVRLAFAVAVHLGMLGLWVRGAPMASSGHLRRAPGAPFTHTADELIEF